MVRALAFVALALGACACGELAPFQLELVDGGAEDAADSGPAVVCPLGGPASSTVVHVGPAAGGTGDLWRGLHDDAGEGQSLEMPRNGTIDRVIAQIFAESSAGHCELRILRWCEEQPVEVARVNVQASAFPEYAIVHPGKTIFDQDLSETSFVIEPPVGVVAGERVDLVFRAVDSGLVSVISMSDVAPDGHAVFPNGAPGLPNIDTSEWDYHARIQLR